jgi:hypothetical protein
VANFSTIFASIVDTGGKFATSVNDTGGKFATSVNDSGGKQRDNYQTADNLKRIFYLYANSTTQRCPKEINHKKFSD